MIEKITLALALLLGSQLVIAQQEKYQEGVHYFKIVQPPVQTDSDSIEVIEVFSYACSHCNTFEPYMQSWESNKPDNVTLSRIPVGFGRRAWELLAQGYITAELMGIAEQSHVPMMDAIWKQRRQFRTVDDLADFYSGFGVTKETFVSTFKSFATDSMMRKSQRDAQLFGVTGTPTLVVDRQYRVGSSQAVANFDAMLDVVDFLIAKELAAE